MIWRLISAIGTVTVYIEKHHGAADIDILIGERNVWGQGFEFDAWSIIIDHLSQSRKIRKITGGRSLVECWNDQSYGESRYDSRGNKNSAESD